MGLQPAICYWFEGATLDIPEGFADRFNYDGKFAGCLKRKAHGPVKGKRGLLASPGIHPPGTSPFYSEARQTWLRVGAEAWIGARKDTLPLELVRKNPLPGRAVIMAAGRRWILPIPNPLVPSCTLPKWDVLAYSPEAGEPVWGQEIQERYVEISNRAADLAATMRAAVLGRKGKGPAVATMEDGDLRQLIADALGLNYDVTLLELSALRVFDGAACTEAAHVLVDWPEMEYALLRELEEANAQDPFPEAAGVGQAPDTSVTLPGAED